jgi:hypothetical protein
MIDRKSRNRPPEHPLMSAESSRLPNTGSYQAPGPVPALELAGRYRLREKIGAGGVGEVCVAEQTDPGCRRACHHWAVR